MSKGRGKGRWRTFEPEALRKCFDEGLPQVSRWQRAVGA